MKYHPRHYAKAFLASLDEGVPYETAQTRIREILAKHSATHALPQVVHEIEKLIAARSGGHMVHVAFARVPNSADEERLLATFSKNDRVTTSVSPALIAGARITVDDDHELDLSLLGKMRLLFQPY